MRSRTVRDPQAGAEIVRVGNAVEHEEERVLDLFQDLIQGIGSLAHLDARDHALVTPAAVEAVQAAGRHAHEVHLGALGHRGEVPGARIVAGFVEVDLEHRRGLGAEAREHGGEAEHHAWFTIRLAAHAGTRSILRWSRSTRTSFTLMRSASRKRLPVRSPMSA